MMVYDLSTVTRDAGSNETLSLADFKEFLGGDLSSTKRNNGFVFWRPTADVEFHGCDSSLLGLRERGNNSRIKRVLAEIISHTWRKSYLVQFWAPEEVEQQQQHVYLTTAHQPFAVGLLCKGLFMYRQRCISHHYQVGEGAEEKELGAVGRVFGNKLPESTPDLRLYSTNEFPLRNYAARCGLRSHYALPVFDLLKEKCYGVIEVVCFQNVDVDMVHLQQGLQAGQLRTSHLNFSSSVPRYREVDSEITKMLESAMREMPQLQMALVWALCRECFVPGNDSSCMEIAATFVNAEVEKVGSLENYVAHCHLHNPQIGKPTNMTVAVISSNDKPCFCRNICDFRMPENPLAHYAQNARLSSCFAIRLERLRNTREVYVVEFFLQLNSREDAFAGSFLPLLLRIMEMKLESFNFPYKGQCEAELVVDVLKGDVLSSGESSQSNAHRQESIKYKLQSPEELSMLMVMEELEKSDFNAYFQKGDLDWVQPSKNGDGFLFQARQELLLLNPIQENIKILMLEISKGILDSHSVGQFWAPTTDGDRRYLETSGQPFVFGCLNKGLAFFRKQSMKHHYFVDEAAKEEELGSPGRVFLNRHPEISPDLRLYSCTEFPLRNDAAHCRLRKYLALPVFDLNQHKCIGVLELFEFSDFTLQVIENALKAAKLSSTHINYKPSFLGSHLPSNEIELRKLALIEIQEACKCFNEIPQLSMVHIWVPFVKCRSINNTMSCMERVWATDNIPDLDMPMCKFQHVEATKGIAGMALASKNRSCFCQNLCEFSTIEEPLAHYAQRHRLDVCFAICLQSCHTGDLLYILEFYLNQGPGKYENLRSFLCLLLPIMNQELESFKVASGQQLGEKLVVEVIEFSEVNELASSELIGQPDISEITFEFVKYHSQKHSNDKQGQFVPDESVTSFAQAAHCSTSAADLKQKTKGTKRNHEDITGEELESHYGKTREAAAEALGGSNCYKKNLSGFMRENANESARESLQNMGLSSSSDLPTSDMPLHQTAPHADPQSSQSLNVQPNVL